MKFFTKVLTHSSCLPIQMQAIVIPVTFGEATVQYVCCRTLILINHAVKGSKARVVLFSVSSEHFAARLRYSSSLSAWQNVLRRNPQKAVPATFSCHNCTYNTLMETSK